MSFSKRLVRVISLPSDHHAYHLVHMLRAPESENYMESGSRVPLIHKYNSTVHLKF